MNSPVLMQIMSDFIVISGKLEQDTLEKFIGVENAKFYDKIIKNKGYILISHKGKYNELLSLEQYFQGKNFKQKIK